MAEFSLRDALQDFLNKSRIRNDIRSLQLEEIWEELMGKTIARYTDKLMIIGDKLIITTQVAPLKNELIFQREKITQRINEALGEKIIREVIIK